MRLLFVEDESYTREGIMRTIAWQTLGIDEVLVAEDGRKGLQMAQEHSPDIVLTDMRMPHLSGPDMARQIRKILPDSSFIFISGYTDVSYFKSAIHLSAMDYITKPLDMDELRSVLQRAVEKQRKLKKGDPATARQRQDFLSILLQESVTADECHALWQQCGAPLDAKAIYTMILLQKQTPQVEAFLTSAAADAGFWLLINRWNSLWVLHLAILSESQPFDDFIKGLLQIDWTGQASILAVSSPIIDPNQLRQAFLETHQAYQRHFYLPQKKLFFSDESAPALDLGFDPTLEFRRRLSQEPLDKVCDWLIDTFDIIARHSGTPVELVVTWTFQILSEIYLLEQNDGSANPSRPGDEAALFQTLKSMPSLKALQDLVLETLCNARKSDATPNNDHSAVTEIQRFIHMHYGDSLLTLDAIAEHVHLSTPYMCNLFKSITGQTVKQCLKACRMRHAKRLLQTTRLTNREIAMRCGYADSNYFIKTFRQSIGLTPQEYHKKNRTI